MYSCLSGSAQLFLRTKRILLAWLDRLKGVMIMSLSYIFPHIQACKLSDLSLALGCCVLLSLRAYKLSLCCNLYDKLILDIYY